MLDQNKSMRFISSCLTVLIMLCANHVHAQGTNSERQCERIDLKELLTFPMNFDGHYICTKGYFHKKDFWTLQTLKNPTEEEYYNIVALLDTNSDNVENSFYQIEDHSFVEVEGFMEFDKDCWEAAEKRNEGIDTDVCVPFPRAIYINVLRISRVDDDLKLP